MCRAVDGGEVEFAVWYRLHHTKLIGIKKMVVMMKMMMTMMMMMMMMILDI